MLEDILKIVSETQSHLTVNNVNTESCPTEELLDNADAKSLLQISDRTLYRWRKEKLIEYQMIGSKHYYRKSELQRFL
jgi:hypothetical protein